MNPLVPNSSEMFLVLGACGYVMALGIAFVVLLRDQGLDANQRLVWLLIMLMLPIVGILTYGLMRRRHTHSRTSDYN